MIITYQENLLLNASSRENIAGEALLFRVLEKVREVERLAMLKIRQNITPSQYEKFFRRIEQIKHKSPCFKQGAQAKLKRIRPGETFSPYPLIAFNQKGRTAGVAYLERWEIRLNPILLVENREEFIQEVIPHEYAHLLVFALFGKVQPHGKEWQMMMTQVMGLPANRTHQFNTDNSVTRQYQRFTYRCECKDHALTTIRHNRIQGGKAQYHCKSCGSALTYIPENLQ